MNKFQDLVKGIPQFTRLMEFENDPTKMYKSVGSAIKQKPTDEIRMTWKDTLSLVKLALNIEEGDDISDIPSDIIFADTIPLKDFRFTMIGGNDTMYSEIEYTFNMFHSYSVIELNMEDPKDDPKKNSKMFMIQPEHLRSSIIDSKAFDMTCVNYGALTIKLKFGNTPSDKDMTLILILTCDPKFLRLPNGVYSWKTRNMNILDEIAGNGVYIPMADEMAEELTMILYMGISVWYAVNTSLLNPVIKDVFITNTKTVPTSTGKATGANKRAKIRYIKQHIITMNDVNKAFEKRGFVRRSMIWYVTGHWREYKKTGKRVFIQGYWKGALREMKDFALQTLEPRERELVTS